VPGREFIHGLVHGRLPASDGADCPNGAE
jgi:hypothetical protein